MICCDKCITVFSFNGRAYERYFFEGVSVFGKDGINIKDSGFELKNEFKIRVPSVDSIGVKPGDRVMLGDASVFDAGSAYTVMTVYDNRRGSDKVKHFVLTVC